MTNQLQPSNVLLWKTYLMTLAAPVRWPVEVWQTRQERQAFEAGVESAWDYCAKVWNRPYVDAWCQLIRTPRRPRAPRAAELLQRFSQHYGRQQEFILTQTQSMNPKLVAYAVRLLEDPNQLPVELREREELIRLRDWHHEVEMTLGEWIERVIEWHNRADEF